MADTEPPKPTDVEDPAAPQDVLPAAPPAPQDKPVSPENPQPPRKKLHIRLFEQGVDAAGYGSVLQALRAPNRRFRAVVKSLGSKLADMAAGRAVSSTFKLIALTWVAGMIGGVSTVGSIALLALAAGASSAIYGYHKDYLTQKLRGPKEKRKEVKYFDRRRLRSAGFSFLGGTASGLFGSWLAKTGLLQNLIGHVKDFITGGTKLVTHTLDAAAETVVHAPMGAPRLTALPRLSHVFNAEAPKGWALPESPRPAPPRLVAAPAC